MQLLLQSIGKVRGCYGPNRDQFPARAAFLAPDAAQSLTGMISDLGSDRVAFSDIWRSGEASLAAVQAKSGVQAPAYSGHNFGVSFDLDVEYTLRALGSDYPRLLQILEAHGWYCYRRDKKRGPEDWHFNFFGDDAPVFLRKLTAGHVTWPQGAEQAIQKHYPQQMFALTPAEIQGSLKQLGLYSGDLDGSLGPLSLQAVRAFCRAWKLAEGVTDDRFKRTLAFVSASIVRM